MSKNFVSWRDTQEIASEKDINDIERKICILFPNDYIECAKYHHGGRPSPQDFEVISNFDGSLIETCLGGLLTFNPKSDYILEVFESLTKEHSLKKIVPFATDGSGDYICFDYRETKENPPVVYWEHEAYPPEKAISYLAPTFTDFLKMLK